MNINESAENYLETILVLSKKLLALKANLSFVLLTLSQMLRSVIIYFAADQYTATISLIFSAFYLGITWSVSTPYLKSIIPENQLASAQGLWTVVAFGIAPFAGSTLCGQLTSILSLKDIFLWISLYLVALCILTYTFFLMFFSIMVYPRILNTAPCALQ